MAGGRLLVGLATAADLGRLRAQPDATDEAKRHEELAQRILVPRAGRTMGLCSFELVTLVEASDAAFVNRPTFVEAAAPIVDA